MSQLPAKKQRRGLSRLVEERPFKGGLTGIALVALATISMAFAGAALVALALLVT